MVLVRVSLLMLLTPRDGSCQNVYMNNQGLTEFPTTDELAAYPGNVNNMEYVYCKPSIFSVKYCIPLFIRGVLISRN